MRKITNIVFMASVAIFFTACTSSSISLMESKSPSFKVGEKDGCKTATGEYTKNSDAFNDDKEYQEGWFAGRKNCNPSQKNN